MFGICNMLYAILKKYSFKNLGNNIELVSWFTLFTIIYNFEWGLHCKSFRGDLWKNDLNNKIMNSCLFCIKCHMQRYCFIEYFHSSRDNMYVYWIVQAIADSLMCGFNAYSLNHSSFNSYNLHHSWFDKKGLEFMALAYMDMRKFTK